MTFTFIVDLGSPGGSAVKRVQEKQAGSLGQEDPLETEMATHSSILAWEIPWTEDLAGYTAWCDKGVGHDLATQQ